MNAQQYDIPITPLNKVNNKKKSCFPPEATDVSGIVTRTSDRVLVFTVSQKINGLMGSMLARKSSTV